MNTKKVKKSIATGLALMTVAFAAAQVQDDGRHREEPTLTDARASQALSAAMRDLTSAGRQVESALPVYGGRRQQIKYKIVFALEDLAALKNVGGRPAGRAHRLEPLSDRLRKIPAVREQSRQDFLSSQIKTSDQAINAAGLSLLDARDSLSKIKNDPSGRLGMARRLIDMALDDVRRSIGRIDDPRPKQERDLHKVGTGRRGG
ncbi:MAG: hypothetical protein JST30_07970 [Armatimonadetes bacterium]|nr:hypothetical protein [Armatimonadota bacterium]